MACGINEHKEGLRKQMVVDRLAFAKKRMAEQTAEATGVETQEEQACGRAFALREADDESEHRGTMRRQDSAVASFTLKEKDRTGRTLVSCSAKLPKRLSSINFLQQY